MQWTTLEALVLEGAVLRGLSSVFMGVYLWDYVHTLWFEWWLLRGRTPFRWPYVSYFLARYSALVFLLLGQIVDHHDAPDLNCQAAAAAVEAMASLGTGCASMNLMIRAVYIWKQMPHASLAIAALVAICIGHWGLLINSFRIIDSDITDSAPSCTISSTNGHMLGIIYAYTLAYDFVVMVASIAALAKMEGSLTKMEDSLPRTLYRQGVGFFLISCVSNLIPMVFAFMRLSPIMDVMLTGPSLIVCVIASCRITTHLIASNAQDRRIPTFANANADNVVVDTQETGPTLQFTSHISMPPNPSQFTLQLKSGVAHRDALDRDRNLDRHDLPSPPPPNSPPDHPPPPGLPFTATDPSPPLHMHHTSHDVVAPSPPPAAHLIGRRIFNYDLHRPRDPPPPSHNGWEIQEVARSSGRV